MSQSAEHPAGDPPAGIELRLTVPVHDFEGHAWAAAWSSDGRRLATAWRDGGDVWAIDTTTWQYEHLFSTDYDNANNSGFVVWSPVDPDLFVQAQGDSMTLLRVDADGRGCTAVWQAPYGSNLGLRPAVSFAPGGDRIAVVDMGPQVTILDAATGAAVATTTALFPATRVRWSPDGGRLVVSGDRDEAVILPL